MKSKPQALPRLDTRYDVISGWRMFSRNCNSAGADRLPVVFVHGLSMSSRYMVPLAQRMSRNYRVYAPDLPGYGKSEHPIKILDVAELSRVLRGWMDFMGLGEVYMIGNSMGTQIITTFEVLYPGRVRKAIFVGPTMDPSATSIPHLFLRGASNMLFEPLSFYPVLIHDYLAAGMRETHQALKDALRDPMAEKLKMIHIPTLVSRGQHDRLVTQDWAEKVTSLLPRGRLEIIPGAAHVANYDAADAVARLAEKFFAD